ncbi:hypothetical protein ACJIZ3_020577 [Penstemon smallii]|uniref:Uncharacterized protein n=1 Tax=Penstemon smallii TaxID=265156 RepID=A0ABD3SJW0_9LAMI
MSTLRSMFSSVESERRWFLEMAKILENKLSVPIYEYQVPKSLRESKPEAYTPQQMGLACYSQYLDLDIQTLALILTIDCLYLLQFLDVYAYGEPSRQLDPEMKEINIRDIMILDNQIPSLAFYIIQGVVRHGKVDPKSFWLDTLSFDRFCVAESPLNVYPFSSMGGASATDDHKQNLSVEEIDIPSVSQMTEFAGIKFIITTAGIRGVKFLDHEEEKKFYLPVIKLNSTSEILLRNLVAFEAASARPGSTLELAEYVDLMCGIIDTPKDVSILKNEKIIESEMSDEEIARIFNGISKSTKKTDKKSKIDETIEGVNKKYDSIRRVKVERFLKKYVPASFKFLGVLITIAVLVLLIINAYCSEFGCGRLFGKK